MSRSILALLLIPLAATTLPAQAAQDKAKPKKLYCWNDPKSGRTCSDALPPDQVNSARDEFSAKSGMRVGEVDQAMSADERAEAAAAAAQARADKAAEDTRRRTEQAMLLSYPNEEQLKRVFDERTSIVDNSVDTARYNVASLRDGLVSKLQQAGSAELAGKPVNAKLADEIRQRHLELMRQQALLQSFEQQRRELSSEVQDTLQRYRELKSGSTPTG